MRLIYSSSMFSDPKLSQRTDNINSNCNYYTLNDRRTGYYLLHEHPVSVFHDSPTSMRVRCCSIIRKRITFCFHFYSFEFMACVRWYTFQFIRRHRHRHRHCRALSNCPRFEDVTSCHVIFLLSFYCYYFFFVTSIQICGHADRTPISSFRFWEPRTSYKTAHRRVYNP